MTGTPRAEAERAIEVFNHEFRAGQTGVSAAARDLYAPEPVIVPFRALLEATEYSGPTALDQFVAASRDSWAWLRIEPAEIRALDPRRALVIGDLVGCGRETGAETRAPLAVLVVVRDGRVAEARTFASEGDALAAVNS